jgi:hypothetical protein
MTNSTPTLIDLRHHYATIIAQSEYQSTQAKEQLAHLDALLENELPQPKAFPLLETAVIASHPAIAIRIEPTFPPVAKASTAIAKAPAAKTETAIAPIKPPMLKTDPAKQRISLPILPAHEGMTKLDAIATVLEKNLGEVLHQDRIIQLLYGELSLADLKKERVRMDTCLRNGVKAHRWKKAPIAASYVLEAVAVGKPNRPGRKPDPTKEPKPEPVAEVVGAIAAAPAKPAATKAKAAKPKPAPKPVGANAKTSKQTARPKRSEVELVALLRKADIQV